MTAFGMEVTYRTKNPHILSIMLKLYIIVPLDKVTYHVVLTQQDIVKK